MLRTRHPKNSCHPVTIVSYQPTPGDIRSDDSMAKQRQVNEALNERACVYIAETMVPCLEDALGSHGDRDGGEGRVAGL